MSEDAIDTFDVTGLEKLIQALHVRPPTCHVGILGDSPREAEEKEGWVSSEVSSGDTPTNAEVGAAHEFGTSTIPMRSFLRVPISGNLQKEMEKSGLFNNDKLSEVLKTGSLKAWLEEVAIAAEACVQDAFDTGGDGKWPAWKDPNYTNNAGQLLVDTKQLRESVTSEVK